MKRVFILTLTLLLSMCQFSLPSDKWTTEQKLTECIALTVIGTDWLQTRYIAEHPNKYREAGCFGLLGEHPDKSSVDFYFAVWAVSHVTITHLLPSKYRRWWQVGTSCIVLKSVADNASIGIELEW